MSQDQLSTTQDSHMISLDVRWIMISASSLADLRRLSLSCLDGAVGVAAVTILGDLCVLLFTWAKTADVWRHSLREPHFKPVLTHLLIRDGKLTSTSVTDSSLTHATPGTCYFA